MWDVSMMRGGEDEREREEDIDEYLLREEDEGNEDLQAEENEVQTTFEGEEHSGK